MNHLQRFLLCCVLAIVGDFTESPVLAATHEFEDGFVERSVSVVVQNQTLIVEYSVGLNPLTMRDTLDQWGFETKGTLPSTGDTDSDRTSDADQKPTNSDSEAAATVSRDAAVERQFLQHVGTRLKQQLEVLVGKVPVELKITSTEISPRHHVNVTVRMESQLEPGMTRIDIQDRNFLETDGGVRYALRTRGSSILHFSNAEPSLIRAERTELGKIRKEKREQYTRLIAKVMVATPPPTKSAAKRK